MSQLKVLLAEDDPNWAGIAINALEGLGYEVVHTTNAVDAKYELMFDDGIDVVVSDLHMQRARQEQAVELQPSYPTSSDAIMVDEVELINHGPVYNWNGDAILEDLLNAGSTIPFVLASATLSDAAKKALVEGVASVASIDKEDYLNPEVLRQKLEYIYTRGAKHIATEANLEAVIKARTHTDATPEIMIEAMRVKGRTYTLLTGFVDEFQPDDFTLLKEAQYHGRTPEETTRTLHDIKNMLTGMAHNNYADNTELQRELLRVSDDIVQIMNTPRSDSMNLTELIARTSSNLSSIYQIEVQVDIPTEIRVESPARYSSVLYALIENALIAAQENGGSSVSVRYDQMTRTLQIINPGEFPEDQLDGDGEPNPHMESSRAYGTGKGIPDCLEQLAPIGQRLTYFNAAGQVYANLTLAIAEAGSVQVTTDEPKPKVWISDYTDGDRFQGVEAMLGLLDPNFEYIWDSDINDDASLIHTLPLEDIWLVIMHPEQMTGGNYEVLRDPEVMARMPNAHFGFITGVTPKLFRENFESRYDMNLVRFDEPPLPPPKPGHIMDYVDFVIGHFPDSGELNDMIRTSRLKYQATLP
tara:strand:+ start:9916 stop:11670 length:1755 start_codon:yes stop_codon:yes gene_type:complete